ncbi:hypothetical protein HDU91_003819, partial [Kappamyces sp. JEL0680]
LDMNAYISDPVPGQVYSLFGVIVHRGSAGSGHYIAYVKHAGQWFEMNDRKTSIVPLAQVLAQSAYMLFYESEQAAVVLDAKLK